MKIIFLDIDGVLNSKATDIKQYNPTRRDGTRKGGIFGVDPENVAVLNDIIERTGAKVVLSSTWRVVFGTEDTLHSMKLSGFKHDLLDVTPDGLVDERLYEKRSGKMWDRKVGRGHEIQQWINDWEKRHGDVDPVTHFVILDDNSDMAHLLPKLVQTEWTPLNTKGGLREEHIEPILKHLGA